MESRKRKEAPGSAGGDDTEISDRPAKSRELNVEEEADKTQEPNVSEAGPAETSVEGSSETNTNVETDPAAINNTIDAAALPSGVADVAIKNESDINAINPPSANTDASAEGNSELDAASGLTVAPSVLPKPSSPDELKHWNQMVRTVYC